MKAKKILALAASALLAVTALTACGGNTTSGSSSESSTSSASASSASSDSSDDSSASSGTAVSNLGGSVSTDGSTSMEKLIGIYQEVYTELSGTTINYLSLIHI